MRCPTSVSSPCSTKRGSRRSVKHAANRRISPRPRSTWPSSSAPAFEVMSPPSKPATTARPSTASNSNSVGVHSVGIGALRETERYCCCTTLFSDSQPRCTPQFEKSGLRQRRDPSKVAVRLGTDHLPLYPGEQLAAIGDPLLAG